MSSLTSFQLLLLPTHHPANQKTDTGPSTTATHRPILPPYGPDPTALPEVRVL